MWIGVVWRLTVPAGKAHRPSLKREIWSLRLIWVHPLAGWRVKGFSKLKVRPAITTQDQTWPAAHAAGNPAPGPNSRVSLLAAVDFKWLMTGHGWWVDSARFHDDPSYAATLLGLAMASPSSALRDCAARLLAQMGGSEPGVTLPGVTLPNTGLARSKPTTL